jgi:hypothetical protein
MTNRSKAYISEIISLGTILYGLQVVGTFMDVTQQTTANFIKLGVCVVVFLVGIAGWIYFRSTPDKNPLDNEVNVVALEQQRVLKNKERKL